MLKFIGSKTSLFPKYFIANFRNSVVLYKKTAKNFSAIRLSNPLMSSSDSEDFTSMNENRHVYVSKHYKEINNDMIISLLEKFKLDHKIYSSGQISVKYCPFCPKPHNFQKDNQFTLNIKPNSGAFFCFRCGIKGSWIDFKNLIYNGIDNHHLFDHTKLVSHAAINNDPDSVSEVKLANESITFLHIRNFESIEFDQIKKYLTQRTPDSRHLSLEILKKYKVGIGFESFSNETGKFIDIPVVYFPMFAPRSKKMKQKLLSEKVVFDENSISTMDCVLVRNKIRGAGRENKIYQRMDPTPGQWGIFGLNTINPSNTEIVITEGEFDAMAVNQATGYQAISLPNGANHLPVQILPFLEKFTKIYLWMDADEIGQSNAKKFAEKLGINRTFIVNTRALDANGPKDANDALREDPDNLKRYLLLAKAISQENITTFSEMKATVYNKILKYEEAQGLKSLSLEWYNKKLKGFRSGEFTIYSGLTGSGKTTLLSQLSLDFCKQGVSTLWGSFEIKNEILMTTMLLQYSEANLIKEPQSFEFYANRFENMPLYFMKFFGSSQLDQIISTIEFAIYTYDISHVVIDNLQFLLSGQGKGFEKFDLQDEAVSRFRKLATSKNIHVSLVIHPRKVDDTQEINMSSIFGTAKSTQEADNVFLIQNHKGYKVLELKKNRFDGEVGSIALGFDKDTKRFFELYQHEVVDLENEKIKIADVVKRLRKQEEGKKENQNKIVGQELSNLEKTKIDHEKKSFHIKKSENEKMIEKKESFNQTLKNDETPATSIANENKEDKKGDNSFINAIKEEKIVDKIIKEASLFDINENVDNNNNNIKGNFNILEERKKNLMMYNKVDKNETVTFFDEEYKIPKNDEIEDLINNTIKNYGKRK